MTLAAVPPLGWFLIATIALAAVALAANAAKERREQENKK